MEVEQCWQSLLDTAAKLITPNLLACVIVNEVSFQAQLAAFQRSLRAKSLKS